MNDASKRVSLLVDLAPLVDGDAEIESRHQGLLADNPAAHQLAQDAESLAERIGDMGSGFVPGQDFEKRLVWALMAAERRRHSEPPQAGFPNEPQTATRPVRGQRPAQGEITRRQSQPTGQTRQVPTIPSSAATPTMADEAGRAFAAVALSTGPLSPAGYGIDQPVRQQVGHEDATIPLRTETPSHPLLGHQELEFDDAPEIDWDPDPEEPLRLDHRPRAHATGPNLPHHAPALERQRVEVRVAPAKTATSSTPDLTSSLLQLEPEDARETPAVLLPEKTPKRRKRGRRLLGALLGCTLAAAVGTLYWLPEHPQVQRVTHLPQIRELSEWGTHWLAQLRGIPHPAPQAEASPPPDNPLAQMSIRAWPTVFAASATPVSTGAESAAPAIPGLDMVDGGVRTPALLLAELSDGRQLLTLGRTSQLRFSTAGEHQLDLDGALLIARSEGAKPLTIATAHLHVHLPENVVVALRSNRNETLVAVLRGALEIDPKQDLPLQAEAGSLVRVPTRGQPEHLALAAVDGLLAEFVPWPAKGHLGRLLPLRYDGGHPPVDNFPLLPQRHAVQVRLSAHHALVEVTETFIVSPSAPALRYQRPLPPGATLVPPDVLNAQPAQPAQAAMAPPANLLSRVNELGQAGTSTVEPQLELSPITGAGPVLELTTRHLVPLQRIGQQRVFEYALFGPADAPSGSSPALALSPVEFDGEVRLQADGQLLSDAPFVSRKRGGKLLTANTAVGADGLRWTIVVDSPHGDGTVQYSAVQPASGQPLNRRGDAALGTLSYRAPRTTRPAQAQHWMVVIDDSYGMTGAARELVAPFVGQLLSALPVEDRATLLRCALECQAESPPPSLPTLENLTHWLASPPPGRARGGFDIGHALLSADALRKKDEALHIVVLSRLGGSAGTVDAARFVELNRGHHAGPFDVEPPAAPARGKNADDKANAPPADKRPAEGTEPVDLPTVSVVQLGQETAASGALKVLSRRLGGRFLHADSTLNARVSALRLLRYQRYAPLLAANLTLTKKGRIEETWALPNLGGENDYQVQLPTASPAIDGAILTGRLGGQPFEHRYTLPAPKAMLDVTPESIAFALPGHASPAEPNSTPDANAAITAYEEALKASKMRPRYRPSRLSIEAFDLTRSQAVPPLPWQDTLAEQEGPEAADGALQHTKSGAPAAALQPHCPPAPPERCRLALAHWTVDAEAVASKHAPSLLQRLGQRPAALDAAIRLASLHPEDADLQLQAGRAYLLKSEPQWACPHLQRAAELSQNPDHLQAALDCWSKQPTTEAQLSQRLLEEQLQRLPDAGRRKQADRSLSASAAWPTKADNYDLGLVDQSGRIYGLLDGSTTLEDGTAPGAERLNHRHLPKGVYTLELWRRETADGEDTTPPANTAAQQAAARTPASERESVRVAVQAGRKRLNLRLQPQQARTELARFIVR